jgi:hypothetical protein
MGKTGINQKQGLGSGVENLLVRHILNEPQTNLSLPNTPHAIQQEEFSTAEFIVAFSGKMFLQFGENVGPSCESNTRVWLYGNGCIGCRSVASASVVIDLPID